ncbi:LuxR C-terminal-related transcriptional regulator [Isoptericola sp. NEAU-Y5]|uniref:LuxR C-terminal-related transcriptional regulator n=1 Tax=Isoptericola luteus TaxID=2879484 RepID=A0ABS7ZGB8_9MICO|nr:LuxR C-terminal-related transcriptional regulator [Isoptericola sp. NEAU-Y5]MCA5894076.1 LuxR C-terminal-related transcriptional regulator [Isoptericola sp. NEAU-Y5]
MSTIELEPMTATFPSLSLTRRERVILSNLSEDVTLEQIATKLFVTRNTVKSQVRSVYRKLGVSSRAEAVAWAQRAGMRAS